MKRYGLAVFVGLIMLTAAINYGNHGDAASTEYWVNKYHPGMKMDTVYIGYISSASGAQEAVEADPVVDTEAKTDQDVEADNNTSTDVKTASTSTSNEQSSSKQNSSKPIMVASSANLTPPTTTTTTNPTPSRGDERSSASGILTTARNYMGVPYVYGGESPKGFDCSGFTQYVYDKNGIALPRTAEAQSRVGKKVTRSELEPGDLVFFNTEKSGSINHVGIYVGNNDFIHASRTLGITVTSLDSSYYKNILVTASRIAR